MLELKPNQKAHLQIHLLQCFPCLQSSITKYDNFLFERVKGAQRARQVNTAYDAEFE